MFLTTVVLVTRSQDHQRTGGRETEPQILALRWLLLNIQHSFESGSPPRQNAKHLHTIIKCHINELNIIAVRFTNQRLMIFVPVLNPGGDFLLSYER